MELNQLENYLLSKRGSEKYFPFGPEVMVFKVMEKMFALLSWESDPLQINLKSLPEDAIVYRNLYPSVQPGYHMNKKHWNTVILDGTVSDEIIKEMIDESYDLIVSKLTKRAREALSEKPQ
jgi:predicted DNA-binding protein (MmcQ/YjbR family)